MHILYVCILARVCILEIEYYDSYTTGVVLLLFIVAR